VQLIIIKIIIIIALLRWTSPADSSYAPRFRRRSFVFAAPIIWNGLTTLFFLSPFFKHSVVLKTPLFPPIFLHNTQFHLLSESLFYPFPPGLLHSRGRPRLCLLTLLPIRALLRLRLIIQTSMWSSSNYSQKCLKYRKSQYWHPGYTFGVVRWGGEGETTNTPNSSYHWTTTWLIISCQITLTNCHLFVSVKSPLTNWGISF